MTKKEQQSIYVSPQVKTIEINAQAIICQSERKDAFNGTEMFKGNDNW